MTSPTVFFTTMVASGSSGRRSLGLNEHEFTALAKAQAQGDRREGETPEQAFTRYYEGNMDVRKAVAALRGYPIARQQERRQELPVAKKHHDFPAIDTLHALAPDLRKREPDLTKEQAFTKVFVDPANLELAKREREERLGSAA